MSKRNRAERIARQAAQREQLRASVRETAKRLLANGQRLDAVRHTMTMLRVGVAEALAFVKEIERARR